MSLEREENSSKLSRPLLHRHPEQKLGIFFPLDYLPSVFLWNTPGFPIAQDRAGSGGSQGHEVLRKESEFLFSPTTAGILGCNPSQPSRPRLTSAGKAAPNLREPRAAPAPARAALPGAPTGMTHPDRIATLLFAHRGSWQDALEEKKNFLSCWKNLICCKVAGKAGIGISLLGGRRPWRLHPPAGTFGK